MKTSGLKQLQSLDQLTTLIGFATEEQEATIAKELSHVKFYNRFQAWQQTGIH